MSETMSPNTQHPTQSEARMRAMQLADVLRRALVNAAQWSPRRAVAVPFLTQDEVRDILAALTPSTPSGPGEEREHADVRLLVVGLIASGINRYLSDEPHRIIQHAEETADFVLRALRAAPPSVEVERELLAMATKHAHRWQDRDEAYWLQRLMQEVGELASVLAGDHDDTVEHELTQVGSIALNWLKRRAALHPLPSEPKEPKFACPDCGLPIATGSLSWPYNCPRCGKPHPDGRFVERTPTPEEP